LVEIGRGGMVASCGTVTDRGDRVAATEV
jgi:hypothetical protein